MFFFFQAEDGIRDYKVTGVQTCALPISENIQKLNFTGIELSGELQLPSDGRLLISYTGLRGVQESLTGLQAKYTLSYPKQDALVAWNGHLPGRLIARTRLGVIDPYTTDPYGL